MNCALECVGDTSQTRGCWEWSVGMVKWDLREAKDHFEIFQG